MFKRSTLIASAAAILLGATTLSASAVTLRYANQGDLKSLDPYTLNETTTNAHLGHVYGKTGTSRQGDLVKLVAGFTSPLAA